MTWALDLGNSHSRVARWSDERGVPELVELPEICRQPGGHEPLAGPRLVPTATELLDADDWRSRVGRWPVVRDLGFLGRRAIIGRPAVERNLALDRPDYAPSFKPWLDRRALEVLARTPQRGWTAREVAESFLWELLASVRRATGERIRDLVVTNPVHAFETYRAELQAIAARLGIRRLRFADEPVAAALGYGLSISGERRILVVDFGAGTLDLALVVLDPRGVEQGRARVMAKDGQELGGNDVDAWFLENLLEPFPVDSSRRENESAERRFWRRVMLAEARRVKESLFFREWALFHFLPPQHVGAPRTRDAGGSDAPEISRERLVEVLEEHRVTERLDEAIDRVFATGRDHGLGADDVDEVLMVGGSTLLPGVYSRVEARFGRDRVRAWEPFEAVARGACVLAADRFAQSDVIFHDYAFVTHDPRTHEARSTVIVPAGTRVPTADRIWTGRVVPTCALGEPERIFKLVICEVARPRAGTRFVRDRHGDLTEHSGGASPEPIVVPLNETDPTLGRLDPPHSPRDRRPRLEISFSVDADRWLRATVHDLATDRRLLESQQVVRLV